MKKNEDIRLHAKSNGVQLWQIAEKLNMHDSNFCRMLRYDLKPGKREEIMKIIEEIKEAGEDDA